MDSLFGLAVLAAIAWRCYKSGKRIGSRKGYKVGRSRGRPRSPPTAALNIIGQHARQLGRPPGRPNLSLSFIYQEAFGHFGRLTHRRSCQYASETLHQPM